MRISALLISVLGLGCASHAGPYVTNVSSDGRGGVVVEKCMTKYDPWMGTVANDQCSSTNIVLEQRAAAEQARK